MRPHHGEISTMKKPSSSSASLRRCPNGLLRASAITSVALASQSWLWADWADIGLGEEPIMILCSDTRERNAPGRRQ
jgi:hypothetical protein